MNIPTNQSIRRRRLIVTAIDLVALVVIGLGCGLAIGQTSPAAAGGCYIDRLTGNRVCPAQQQQPKPRWPDPTVVLIGGAGGTCIEISGERKFILTAAHMVHAEGEQVVVENRLGFKFP